MRIILLKDVDNLGKKGEVKDVASGYARNFLLPKGSAILASTGALKIIQERLKLQEKKLETVKKETQKIKEELEKRIYKIEVKSGKIGKIFGAVTHKEIADLINRESNLNIDKKQIEEKPIKKLGEHIVKIKLTEGIEAQIKLKVETKKKISNKKS